MQKLIRFSIYFITLSLPLYLINFKIFDIPVNFLEIFIYLIFIVYIIFIIKNNKKILFSNFYIYILLILAGVSISTIFSSDLRISAGIWKGWFIVPLLFFILLINNINTKKHIKNIIIFLTISGIIVSFIALYYFLTKNLDHNNRLQAFYNSPNYLAMYLSPILILSFYLYYFFKNNIFKIIIFFSQFLLLFIIYLTYSYGAFLGLLGSLLMFVILSEAKDLTGGAKRRPVVSVVADRFAPARFFSHLRFLQNDSKIFILLLIFIIIFLLAWQSPSQKLQSRLIIWQSALEVIKNNPIIGIGPGLFQKYYPNLQAPQPHNVFLAFYLQTGLLGLFGFILLLFKFFKKNLFIIFNIALIYIIIHGLVDTTYWKNDLSIIFWLIVGLSCIASRLFYSQKQDNLLDC